MSGEMIERVAKALALLNCSDQTEAERRWKNYCDDAIMAIEAMREPTGAMRVAALNATFDADRGGDRVYVGDVPIIWEAMIDAALAESEGT